MKRFFLAITCSLCFGVVAQKVRVGASYTYLYAGQWDKAIQTYNFSRPFLTKPQPLLIHSAGVSGTYFFGDDNEKMLKHGIRLSYNYARSTAENTNFTNILQLHLLTPGYVMHWKIGEKALYAEASVSVLTSGLFRQVNSEPVSDDDTPVRAFGIGGLIEAEFGYRKLFPAKNSIDPFVSVGYAPYLFSRNSEAVLNQTSGLTGRNWTGLLQLKVGVQFTFGVL
ncbi:MAG: hypothetical protein QE487_06645 [Fluviicola sp.]|nr:hypothetical protein [Fluviicola sp.]